MYAIVCPQDQFIEILSLPIECFSKSEKAGGFIESELVIVSLHERISEGSDGIWVRGSEGGNPTTCLVIFGHCVAARYVSETWGKVVLVQDGNAHLKQTTVMLGL